MTSLQSPINTEIRLQLEKFHCTRGHLRYQTRDSATLLNFNGWRTDNQPVLIWQTPILGKMLDRYLQEQQQGSHSIAGIVIEIDLSSSTFDYQPITTWDLQKETHVTEKANKEDAERKIQTNRETLQQRTLTYGVALAEKVVAALRLSQLAYGHRDYCGTGLWSKDGIYYYGEVSDGYFDNNSSLRQFDDQKTFVAWLAVQSDASLARLEEKDPWYWGNQTITRQRLEEFAALIPK